MSKFWSLTKSSSFADKKEVFWGFTEVCIKLNRVVSFFLFLHLKNLGQTIEGLSNRICSAKQQYIFAKMIDFSLFLCRFKEQLYYIINGSEAIKVSILSWSGER